MNTEVRKSYIIKIVLVIIIILCFYLFIIRPSSIKKECYKYASTAPIDIFDYYYNACLHRNGL